MRILRGGLSLAVWNPVCSCDLQIFCTTCRPIWLFPFRIAASWISCLRPSWFYLFIYWKSDKNPFLVSGRVCCYVKPPPPLPLAVWPWKCKQPTGQGGAALVCSYWTLSLAHIVKWSGIKWTDDLSSPDKPPGNNSWPQCLKEKRGKDDFSRDLP